MSEMVERAVRALEHLGYSATDEEKVHAVISAMREPTEAMEIAGHGTAIDVDGTTHMVSAKACWQAMVDAALEPGS